MTTPDEPFRIITITVNGDGELTFDSDLPPAESLWVLMDAIRYLMRPEERDRAVA